MSPRAARSPSRSAANSGRSRSAGSSAARLRSASTKKSSCAYEGRSHHSVPSLSKQATRRSTGTADASSRNFTRRSRVAPARQDGSSSAVALMPPAHEGASPISGTHPAAEKPDCGCADPPCATCRLPLGDATRGAHRRIERSSSRSSKITLLPRPSQIGVGLRESVDRPRYRPGRQLRETRSGMGSRGLLRPRASHSAPSEMAATSNSFLRGECRKRSGRTLRSTRR